MIRNILDKTIPSIINHNLGYRTTVSIIAIIEEFNKLLTKNNYRDKGVAHGMIRIIISTPEKPSNTNYSIENDYNYRKKHQQIHLQLS